DDGSDDRILRGGADLELGVWEPESRLRRADLEALLPVVERYAADLHSSPSNCSARPGETYPSRTLPPVVTVVKDAGDKFEDPQGGGGRRKARGRQPCDPQIPARPRLTWSA